MLAPTYHESALSNKVMPPIVHTRLFIGSGILHFSEADSMIRYSYAKDVPQPKLAALVSGLWIVIGALSIALGV